MKWADVRELYSDQWVKLKILDSDIDEDYLYIDEMEIIKTKLVKNLGLFR